MKSSMLEYEVLWNLENSPAGSTSWVDPKEPVLLRTTRDVLEKKRPASPGTYQWQSLKTYADR